ncbi:hypothetical protein A6A22_13400 [Arthrobacter sp. OY3WO11]|nr:hypothetical protein A6A22_13400 [Arthrobacter sp. OY3WO11]
MDGSAWLVIAVGNPLGLADTHSRIVGTNTAVAGAGLGLAVPITGRVRMAYLVWSARRFC